jgi:hypothetical protein
MLHPRITDATISCGVRPCVIRRSATARPNVDSTGDGPILSVFSGYFSALASFLRQTCLRQRARRTWLSTTVRPLSEGRSVITTEDAEDTEDSLTCVA